MASSATGTFEIELNPGPPELDGAINRLEFAKTFSGDLEASGRGLMLSGGDPQKGAAGYVAVETVRGRLGEHEGAFAMQQLASMNHGEHALRYEIVPGSGRGALEGIIGVLHLTVEPDGTHRYELEYEL